MTSMCDASRFDVPKRAAIGVDTHSDVHVGAGVTSAGDLAGPVEIANTMEGFAVLERWALSVGPEPLFGIEGTSSWGQQLACWLAARGYEVREISGPSRQDRRLRGKSDPADAIAAAWATWAGKITAVAKDHSGIVEAIRALFVVRKAAAVDRAKTLTRARSLITTGPSELSALKDLPKQQLMTRCVRLRPGSDVDDPVTATKAALVSLGRQHRSLTRQIADLDAGLEPLVQAAAPELLDLFGVGHLTAAQILITAGENHDRIHSEAAFAKLCGVAPIDASSGKQQRHRLNRGGDRQANAAITRIARCRLAHDQRTKDYMTKRLNQGKTRREAERCIKRAIARELFKHLPQRTP